MSVRSTPANARRTGKPSPSSPLGAVLTPSTGRSTAAGAGSGSRGRVSVSAVTAGIDGSCGCWSGVPFAGTSLLLIVFPCLYRPFVTKYPSGETTRPGRTVRCPSCGTENEPGRKFCSECGAALARLCPACGTANAPAAKFCGECGAALAQSEPSEPDATGVHEAP